MGPVVLRSMVVPWSVLRCSASLKTHPMRLAESRAASRGPRAFVQHCGGSATAWRKALRKNSLGRTRAEWQARKASSHTSRAHLRIGATKALQVGSARATIKAVKDRPRLVGVRGAAAVLRSFLRSASGVPRTSTPYVAASNTPVEKMRTDPVALEISLLSLARLRAAAATRLLNLLVVAVRIRLRLPCSWPTPRSCDTKTGAPPSPPRHLRMPSANWGVEAVTVALSVAKAHSPCTLR